jgi:hypothetical protein
MGREVRGDVCRLVSFTSGWGPVADSGDHNNNQGPDFDDMSSFFSLCSKRCF